MSAPAPIRPAASRAAARLWWLALGSATLLVLSLAGIALMQVLQQRATAHLRRLCETLFDTSGLRWSHGYGAWLPIATLTATGLAVVVAVVVLCVARGSAPGAGVLAVAVIPLALIVLLISGVLLNDFYAFPGGDISTSSSPPCGAG